MSFYIQSQKHSLSSNEPSIKSPHENDSLLHNLNNIWGIHYANFCEESCNLHFVACSIVSNNTMLLSGWIFRLTWRFSIQCLWILHHNKIFDIATVTIHYCFNLFLLFPFEVFILGFVIFHIFNKLLRQPPKYINWRWKHKRNNVFL